MKWRFLVLGAIGILIAFGLRSASAIGLTFAFSKPVIDAPPANDDAAAMFCG